MVLTVDRRQVLAYRVAAHGLARDVKDPRDLGVLDLGIQDSQFGTARLALAARLPFVPTAAAGDPVSDETTYALLWSFRGAPHLHRRTDLPALTAALWPLDDADAMTRLASARKPMAQAGISGLEAFTAAAKAMRAVVTKALPKGEVSAGVTAALSDAYAYACRSCASTHVYGSIFQLVGLPAGVRHVPDRAPLTLVPLEGRSRVPTKAAGTVDVVRTYLRLHGPASAAEAASYLGTTQAKVRTVWPDDLAEVSVEGRRCWLPEEQLLLLRKASRAPYVRLLPALDPFLQSRDRDLLVPDPGQQKVLWKILGNPGALLVDGEVAGTWRVRGTGKKRLTVTVEAFGTLSAKVRAAIDAEAARIAQLREASDVAVSYGSG
ncbi:winged helix DNA-binding domain-containing protein [Actinopolymorpha sp. B11F2]|uniref:winged helix DNA-binding domain-containing protein n=1 Tax=Actinopolymorpha sp. B11F2 TaxID=3160862 RepID=UPI0032E43B24